MIRAPVINPIVERQLAAFEAAVGSSSSARFTDFFVRPDHEDYQPVATELMRVDLELAWQRGEPRRVDDYLTLVPKLLDDAEVRADVAFEEYRTRVEFGEDVDAAEYETKYNVDTTGWTRLEKAQPVPSDAGVDRKFDEATPRYVPTSPGQPPSPGDEWGDFEILDELGRGSLARTYLAKQRSLADRLVAVKFSAMATNESDKLARLQHPNIVPIYSIHQDDRWSVTCMPFRGRTTLTEVVSRPQLLDEVDQQYGSATREESVLRLVLGLADGLAHAHSRGILHRDVKPANVLLTDDGEPMLLDFNLAVDRDELRAVAGGTVPYMAPEQLRLFEGQGGVDERSDVYSLGVVLVQLLTGQLPWHVSQADVDSELPKILAERQQTDFAEWNTCTPAVIQIVRKCLAPSAADRYQAAADLAEDIRRHLADRPLKHARNRSLTELARKWARRHPRLCSLTSAAVLLVAGAIALAGAWTVREQQLAGARATERLMTVTQELDALRPTASTIALFPEQREALRGMMDQLADRAGVRVDDAPNSELHMMQFLSPEDATAWRAHCAELAYLRAHLELLTAKSEPDVKLRAEQAAEALRWNQLCQDIDDTAIAPRWQQAAINALLDDQGSLDRPIALPDLDTPPTNPRDAVLAGLSLLYDHQQPAAAVKQLRRAVKLAPTEPAAWLLLVEASLLEEEFSQAESYAEVAIALLPDSTLPFFQRGVARLRSGQYQSAADDFRMVLEREPHHQRARMNLALALKALEQLVAAEQQLTTAIEGGFDDPRALLTRARVRRNLGDHPRSRADVDLALSLPAVDLDGLLAQGVARVSFDPPKALEDFAACLELNPRCAAALHNMAYVQSEKLGNSKSAIELLTQAIRLNPDDTMALAGRGVLYARQGQTQLALQDAERLAKLNVDVITEFQLSCIHALLAKDSPNLASQALRLLASSLSRDPTLVDLAADDPDLDNVRDSTTYREVISAARQLRAIAQPGESP